MFRDRRQERREERREERRGEDTVQYRMRQRIVSIGDDFWIEDSGGRRAYKVDGKALRVRDTLRLEDADGTELFTIQARVVRVRDTMEIEDAGGRTVATVRKAMITPLRERWSVDVEGAPGYEVQGNVVDHEYTIESEGRKIAEVSKRWFRVADTYGVEVVQGLDPALVLAVTVVVDAMAHPDR
jgi:uncharacterized protein YxjI